jgi:hypothetical protein
MIEAAASRVKSLRVDQMDHRALRKLEGWGQLLHRPAESFGKVLAQPGKAASVPRPKHESKPH